MDQFIEYYVLYGCSGWQRRFNQSIYLGNDVYGYRDKDEPVFFTVKFKSKNSSGQLESEIAKFLRMNDIIPPDYPGFWQWRCLIPLLADCDQEGNFQSMNRDGVIAPGKITSVEYVLIENEEGFVSGMSKHICFTFESYVHWGKPSRLKAIYEKID